MLHISELKLEVDISMMIILGTLKHTHVGNHTLYLAIVIFSTIVIWHFDICLMVVASHKPKMPKAGETQIVVIKFIYSQTC